MKGKLQQFFNPTAHESSIETDSILVTWSGFAGEFHYSGLFLFIFSVINNAVAYHPLNFINQS
jgi:hypothetical protein